MSILANDGKVILTWPGSVSIGRDGYYLAYGEATAGGGLDLDNRLIARRIQAWPDGYPGGFGYGPFGQGNFGYGYGGIGFGLGMFGRGAFGRGVYTVTAVTPRMQDGTWTFQVIAYDEHGNADPSGDRVTAEVDVAGTPRPCGVPTGGWAAGTLTLTYALSPDDEDA